MQTIVSIRLAKALQRGKAKLSDAAREQMVQFIRSEQLDDGSFKDRSRQSDVYYTAFGWLLCWVFAVPLSRKKAGDYLRSIHPETLDVVHYAAYIRCRLLLRLLTRPRWWNVLLGLCFRASIDLKTKRNFPHNDANAPYSQFLHLTLVEDSGRRSGIDACLWQKLEDYRTRDGGFSNLKNSSYASVNATAAALCVLGQMNGYQEEVSARYLLQQQHNSGGFAASKQALMPDLLSTATALFVLHEYRLKPTYNPNNFIEAHWNAQTGGFCATLFEEVSDTEYTFYGLLALGSI